MIAKPRATAAKLSSVNRWWWPAIVVTTLLGLGIRLWEVTFHGAWFDEGYYAYLAATGGPIEIVRAVLASPPSAPLYALILDAWVAIFGDLDLAIRLPSVLAGTATIPATVWLVRELTGRRGQGLLAATLVAVSPFAVQLSQEARPYALGALTLTTALAAQWRWRHTARARDAGIAVVLAIVAVHVHYLSAVVLGLVALSGPGMVERRRWVLAHVLVLLAWAPWSILSLLAAATVPLRTDIASPATVDQVLGTLVAGTSGTGALREGIRALEIAGLLVGGVLLSLAWSVGARRSVLVAASSVVLVPALASAVIGRWLFSPAFMGLILPILLVMIALAARRWLAIVLLCFWLPVQGAGLIIDRTARWHDDDAYREMAAVIEERAEVDAPILVTPPLLVPGLAHYTDRPLRALPEAFDPQRLYMTPDTGAVGRAMDAALAALSSDAPAALWLVYRAEEDPDGRLLAGLCETFAEGDRWTYDVADLYQFVH